MRWLLSILLVGLWGAVVHALSSAGNRLLAILDDVADKDLFSTFWKDLEGRGYSISFQSPKDQSLSLFKHGERAYDHIALFPLKSKGLGPALTPKTLLEFINSEGNVLLALSGGSAIANSVSSLLLELEISLSQDRHALVVDHFNYDTLSSPENHDVILLPRPQALRADLKSYFSGEGVVAFPKAAGQSLGAASSLLVPIFRAPETAYSYDATEEEQTVDASFAFGSQISLVSAMQARNSARFTVVGSAESLEDKWFSASVKGLKDGKKTQTVNREFAKQISAWTFKETGVIKVGKVQHYLNADGYAESAPSNESGALNPSIYRIKNDVTFNIELSEYNDDHYIPFETPEEDAVQLEFTMLSPFHRLTLKPVTRTANSTMYSTSFTLPDQHGIFSFRVNYKRPFLTNVDVKEEVTVRHFAHDEWPRSWKITGGWVWIAGLWSVIGGFLIFVAVWLYSAPPETEKSRSKKVQ
ncbi:dolichyl-diphosphooligosaccharide-protein glycosyltransferase [Histoplasma capsulatum G186AR]|uniref:Dolichyl-diphosphooligosaccharide--protein glycosyltransferase subunit WBP1 n=2 Tax=Ajellomyces capsulatus TaxID=5037 RepID=C0P0G8_AJECG|nr:dolichyl-diphosphooligosaccharide-protein glycosyltransferase [Histoplasma capsulatum G186AR]EEH02788.1 dolichyl-diphosphooligosaccharide-protein glycosyltransferase [Histoplasma capsulatum G186AR]KAG5305089.1 dolichyl-diphosphooligosaccharide-protein glycosyltransferase [Histoplasma capsulatum]QSS76049.1 dolichyl-diphosphooligosaccharide-protein glycosyltransferase [Histoplasma capsulatum G186AR]